MFKILLGIAPKLETDGTYSPSKLALKLSTIDISHFNYEKKLKYQGEKSKILVIFTEQKNMEMENGTLFSTGNHPIEAFVPMCHLQNAGFKFDIATATGRPAVLEMWAFPKKDKLMNEIYDKYKSQLEQPLNLQDLISNDFLSTASYAGVFIPGGHGAMLGLPNDENVGKILNWAYDNDVFTITLCHGPASLLSTIKNDNTFIYKGYKMAVFPDAIDNQAAFIGYLPGKMCWGLSEKLEKLGVHLINNKPDDSVCLDRKLITGASPLAANALGQLAVNTLLNSLMGE